MNANLVDTNGKHPDFVYLTGLLDDEYYQIFGDAVLSYNKHNVLTDINDVVLIYIENKPIACGSFKVFDRETVEIKRVFVLKKYRRQGLSIQIMEHLERIAIQKGYEKAVLETSIDLHNAISLYKSLGYQFTKNYNQFKNNPLCVYMRKAL